MLHFIRPNWNICECIFSKAGYPLTDCNTRLISERFERQMFLNVKNKLWDISHVNHVLN